MNWKLMYACAGLTFAIAMPISASAGEVVSGAAVGAGVGMITGVGAGAGAIVGGVKKHNDKKKDN